MERQSVDEERHRTSPPPSAIVTSVPDIGTENISVSSGSMQKTTISSRVNPCAKHW